MADRLKWVISLALGVLKTEDKRKIDRIFTEMVTVFKVFKDIGD